MNSAILDALDASGVDPDDKDAVSRFDKWSVASKIEPRGDAAKWKELFEKLGKDGHQIGVPLAAPDIAQKIFTY